MRIIAGAARGRRLRAPRGEGTRPMQDRVKEAIFSSLGALVPGARVLDLYAGTGAMGLEALSRGAAGAVFVERDRSALDALRTNIETVGLGGQVVAGDVPRYLAGSEGQFDLVFVDPPYPLGFDDVCAVLELVAGRLEEGGTVILHRRAGEDRPEVAGLEPVDARRYGGAQLWRYEKETE